MSYETTPTVHLNTKFNEIKRDFGSVGQFIQTFKYWTNQKLKFLLGGDVGLWRTCGGLFPNVDNAVELTPNKTIKIPKNMVIPPHFVYLFKCWAFIFVLLSYKNILFNFIFHSIKKVSTEFLILHLIFIFFHLYFNYKNSLKLSLNFCYNFLMKNILAFYQLQTNCKIFQHVWIARTLQTQ